MANRLKDSASLYLQQHSDEPVDWYPWGEEALEKARRENKPIFLSVGYSSCHWCHVMAHESFDEASVAEVMNRAFVSIKVDREERPDVDETYMTAVQLSTGRGGWPMSVFLTPELEPFFAGTYFPREDRGPQPGFRSLCKQIEEGWSVQEAEIRKAGKEFAEALRRAIETQPESDISHWTVADIDEAVEALADDFDRENGGFGGAPKFPPHSAIWFLTDYIGWRNDSEKTEKAKAILSKTLESLVCRGLFDHVGGGFHRYSTDDSWHLPHFEKMLYDNAWMLWNLGRSRHLLPDLIPVTDFAIQRTLTWLRREMTASDGLLYSALDADSEGEEGKFYVWTLAEIEAALGEDAQAFIARYGMGAKGNFYDEATHQLTGQNLLNRSDRTATIGQSDLDILLAERSKRVKPATDDKCLLGWNGMAAMGLAAVGESGWAKTIVDSIWSHHSIQHGLPRYIKGGKAFGNGFLDDYVFLLAATILVEDHARAHALLDEIIERFWDSSVGACASSSKSHESLFGRSRPVLDQPIPSANAVLLWCANQLGSIHTAEALLQFGMPWMHRAPHATEAFHAASLGMVDANSAQARVPLTSGEVDLRPRDVEFELLQGQSDETGMDFTIVVKIPFGWSIVQQDNEEGSRTPLSISVIGADFSEGERFISSTEISIPFRLTALSTDRPQVAVRYQVCTDEVCLLPMTRTFDLQFVDAR